MSQSHNTPELIVPQGRRGTALYGNGSTFGMYEFSDGTVCAVITDPEQDQNLVVIDSHLGTPGPMDSTVGRYPFSDRVAMTRLMELIIDTSAGATVPH